MSHLATSRTIDGKPLITDLEILKRAAAKLNLEFREDLKRMHTYGGGATLQPDDVGLLRLTKIDTAKYGTRMPYDIAVRRHASGQGYDLVVDTYDHQIRDVIGETTWERDGQSIVCPKLMMEYYMEVERTVAAENGDEVEFTVNEDGTVTSRTYPALTRLQETY